MIQLDQNAGLPISEEVIQQYMLYGHYNNVYGFGDQKRQLQQEIEQQRQQLCKLFGFDRVIYTSGATQIIHDIFERISNIKVFDGQHPSVSNYESIVQREDGVCLVCLVNSATSEIQFPPQDQIDNYQYVVLDISQAIGKGKFGSSAVYLPKQGEKNVHCMFFSMHKLGGVKNSGFIICSNEFYNRYMVSIKEIQKKPEENQQLHPDFQKSGSFDISGFMSSSYLLQQIKIPQKKEMYNTFIKLRDILKKCPEIKNINPVIGDINNLNDYPNCFSSITFELENLCPRSFQHLLENAGVQIGFKTACQSSQTGVLRMSWRQPVVQFKFIEKCFIDQIQYLKNKELSGGMKLNQSFLQYINQNQFWLTHHFVPSHDAEPFIDKKYEIMFQPDLLQQFTTISLKIPPHHPTHRTELEIIEKKRNGDDFNEDDDKIRIQKRRLSKYLFINNPDATYELSLEDFEKETIKIQLSDQVFRSVNDNFLQKKKFPTEFQQETKEYEIQIKKYPETLLQQITVKHPHPDPVPPKHTRRDKKKENQKKEKETKVENKKIEIETEAETEGSKEIETETENSNDGDEAESEGNKEKHGGRKDPNYIREQITFLISSYNLKLLTFLGGNNLSVAILSNLEKLYKRGEAPSKYDNPHQCIVQDLEYIDYQNCFGTVLTSMNLMKEIDFYYPQFINQRTSIISSKSNKQYTYNKPESKFYSENKLQFSTTEVEDKVIIQHLRDSDITKIIQFIEEHNPKKIVVYLPHINEDEITQEFGFYHYFHKHNFQYVFGTIEYYDTWNHQYYSDKPIVKFYK